MRKPAADDGGMTTSEYLLNAAFVLLVLRQARERELDRRSVIVPLVLMFFVGSQYLHALPPAGNDLLLIVGLGAGMAFAFAIGHGFGPAVRSFSIAHRIGAAAWPVALVLLALIEVGSRIAVVQVRGRRLVAA